MNNFKILKDLVSINTVKDKENTKIIEYIEEYLKKYNFKTEYKGKCLIMSIGYDYKLGFLGHTDTVDYIDNWNTNPFKLTEKENKLYGLGVCDMKAGIAAFMQAISEIDLSKLKYGIKTYFTYDEEIGFSGIKEILNTREIFPNTLIFGEPTYNEILEGGKGLLEYSLNFKGIKVHSNDPEKGKSANLNAIKFITELDSFYKNTIKVDINDSYTIPYTTMNVGLIKGGNSINSVSSSCNVLMDFRVVNKSHIEAIKNKIEKLAKKYDCNYEILNCLEPFLNENKFNRKTANYITEANFIKTSKKIILGAGPITAHETNEYITKESYNKLVTQYKELIFKYCK